MAQEKQFGSTTIRKYNFPADHWARKLPLNELKDLPEGRRQAVETVEGFWFPWTFEDLRRAKKLQQASGAPVGEILRALLKRLEAEYDAKQQTSGSGGQRLTM